MASVTVASGGTPGRLPETRSGLGYWLNGYRRMFVWDLVNLRTNLPVLTAVLVLQGAGFAVGVGLFFRDIPEAAAMYVVTGVPVVIMLSVSLIFEPQIVAAQRSEGSYEFIRSMPVPRSMMTAAWYTVSLIPALPAVVIALVVGVLRFDLHLHVTAAIVPAILFTSVCGVLMGYAVAHGIREPRITQLISVSTIFVIFGFSPIMFPPSQLPQWLAEVNRWLPFGSMATIIRSALVEGVAADVGRAYVVVGVWAVLSGLVAARAVGHRR